MGRGLRNTAAVNKNLLIFICILFSISELAAQGRNAGVKDAGVKKDEVSIHTVERGSMPIFVSATATACIE